MRKEEVAFNANPDSSGGQHLNFRRNSNSLSASPEWVNWFIFSCSRIGDLPFDINIGI